jgi:hypothetical protein
MTPKKYNYHLVHISISEELHNQVRAEAKLNERTVSRQIAFILKTFFESKTTKP